MTPLIRKTLFASLAALGLLFGWEAVLLGPPVAWAEVKTFNGAASPSPGTGISVTSTAATQDLGISATSVSLTSFATSSSTVYARIFWCGETAADASLGVGISIPAGSSVSLKFNTSEAQGITSQGYCNVSLWTASAARITIIAK